MAGKVKTGPKMLAVILVISGLVYGARWWVSTHGTSQMASVSLEKKDLAEFKEEAAAPAAGTADASATPGTPGTKPADLPGSPVRFMIIPWNAQFGLLWATGGAYTAEGSLMAKEKVKLALERQDDYGKMQEALTACADELSKGAKVCREGVNFVSIMGDAGAAFFDGLNKMLAKYGPEYVAEVVASSGRSFGEDKFMGPIACQQDPAKCRGLLVAGVLKDGDWNIAMFWAAANQICNNPDPTTYNPDCLNWVGTSSFGDADDKYIQGSCEDRPVVTRNAKGKDVRTGETKHVCVGGVVTWTPGDVTVTQKKGGLASIWSTRQNDSQMPQVTIGIRKWDRANRDTVKGLIRAMLAGGDAVKRGGPAVLRKAGDISAKVYGEGDAAYWAKYYKGVEEDDKTGQISVPLGGSRVFNLADDMRYFGLTPGAPNAFEITYTTFGNFAKANYPADLPSFPAWDTVTDLSYLKEVAAEGLAPGVADAPKFEGATAGAETAQSSWTIEFETGKATITAASRPTLEKLLGTLVLAGNTLVDINGHTDNVGSPDANRELSKARADAVLAYLKGKAADKFPDLRVTANGFGQDKPVADNATPAGRAKNRRVEIVIHSLNG